MKLLKKQLSFYKEVAHRWKTPLGSFWKHIRTFAITLGVSAVSVITVDKMFDLQSNYGVSPMLFTICGYVIVFCAALGLASQITTKHPEDFDNEQ